MYEVRITAGDVTSELIRELQKIQRARAEGRNQEADHCMIAVINEVHFPTGQRKYYGEDEISGGEW